MQQEARRMPDGTTDVAWASPEGNLWVATMTGEYGGMVEFTDGHFVVRNPTGHHLGSFSNLPEAKARLVEQTPTPNLLGVVQTTLHSITESLAAALPKPAPQYHRNASASH